MIRRLKKLNQAGDTIVEVLIVLAVLGLALSIAYATANRGLQQSRNAQEHSQALGIINSQVELLRSAFAKGTGGAIENQGGSGPDAGPFCLTTSGTNVEVKPLAKDGDDKFNESLADDQLGNTNTYPGPCIDNTFYNISIVPRGDGVYDFRVRWEGLGSLGRQQEEITYKIGNVDPTVAGGYTESGVPPPEHIPLSLAFTVSPATIEWPGIITLDWSTAPDGASCKVTGLGTGAVKANGTEEIRPEAKTPPTSLTYTMTCTLGDETKTETRTVTVKPPYVPALATLYRWYHGTDGAAYDHFYTTSNTEGNCCSYTLQGNIGKVDTNQGPGEIPLYRFYEKNIGDHFYTTDEADVTRLRDADSWLDEGITGYIKPYAGSGECPAGTKKLYRMYSDYLSDHFYTDNVGEYNDGRDYNWPRYSLLEGGIGSLGGYNPGKNSGPGPYRLLPPPAYGNKWYNRSEGIIGCIFN